MKLIQYSITCEAVLALLCKGIAIFAHNGCPTLALNSINCYMFVNEHGAYIVLAQDSDQENDFLQELEALEIGGCYSTTPMN